jgi:hypothetical protein
MPLKVTKYKGCNSMPHLIIIGEQGSSQLSVNHDHLVCADAMVTINTLCAALDACFV